MSNEVTVWRPGALKAPAWEAAAFVMQGSAAGRHWQQTAAGGNLSPNGDKYTAQHIYFSKLFAQG